MPPKRPVKEPAAHSIDPWLPVAFPEGAKIEIQSQDRRLIVTNNKFSGTDANYATLTYPGGEAESCIALCKRPSDAREAFERSGVNDLQLPMKPLKLQKGSIFYKLKNEGQFHVLVSDFEDPGKFHVGKGRNRSRRGSSTEQDVKTVNWNGLGKFLKELSGNIKEDSELEHLVHFLGKASVIYDDLVWEPAMWMLRTKLQLIREVFWCCDKDPTLKATLTTRNALGLQSCINKMAISRGPKQKKV